MIFAVFVIRGWIDMDFRAPRDEFADGLVSGMEDGKRVDGTAKHYNRNTGQASLRLCGHFNVDNEAARVWV